VDEYEAKRIAKIRCQLDNKFMLKGILR
jgi:hypothetical protein